MPGLTYPYTFVANTKAKASEVNANFAAIETLLETTKLDAANIQNGSITEALLADALKAAIGVGASARGKSVIPTEESRVNAAYGLMTTPDQVQNLVVPANATVRLEYNALWKESVADAARAAIFIDSNQLKVRSMAANAPVTQAAALDAVGADVYRALRSFEAGLFAVHTPSAVHSSDVTTGQAAAVVSDVGSISNNPFFTHEIDGAVEYLNMEFSSGEVQRAAVFGGVCLIRGLAADTYDFSVQFKASSGSVTVKEREFKVAVEAF